MITVENLLDAYAHALDLWIDPELAMLENGHPRKNPTPEYAELIRKAVSAENAKLRELAHLVAEYVSVSQCEGCVAKRACSEGELDMCWIRKAILEKLRELGVEVDA